jgi:hypothetical protein
LSDSPATLFYFNNATCLFSFYKSRVFIRRAFRVNIFVVTTGDSRAEDQNRTEPAGPARRIVAGLAAVAGLTVGGVAAASTSSPAAPHGTAGPKPTIVLVGHSYGGAHITEVKAPHLSMIAAPGVVTQVILKAVHATS